MVDPMLATPVLERTTAAIIERNVAERPEHVALVDVDGSKLTYKEVQDASFRIAKSLFEVGLNRQDNVLVMLDNHADHALAWLGITVGALVDVPINTAFKGDILTYVCEMSNATVIIIEDAYCDRLAALRAAAPMLKTVIVRGGDGGEIPGRFQRVQFEALLSGRADRPEPPNAWDINNIIFTSGTTGRPKGVMSPHGHSFSMASYPAWEPGEIVLVCLPLFHNAGLCSGVLNAWRAGGTAVLVGQFSVSRFWDQVREHNCTGSLLFGVQISFLWAVAPSASDRDHSLRTVVLLPCPTFVREFESRFGVLATSGYGSSESGTVVTATPGEINPAQCGKPRSFADVRIFDEHDIELPQGSVGEIVIRTSEPWSMMLGYYGMPDETARVFRNLWLHSGDAGYFAEDGNLVFVDRKSDALRRRGENVSSFEVERVILQRPDVVACAVVAVRSEHAEDEVKAVLVLAPEAKFDPEEMIHDLAERMPYFMVPRFLDVVEALPVTATAKIRKVELREAGISPTTWDCEAAGYRITRQGLTRVGETTSSDRTSS